MNRVRCQTSNAIRNPETAAIKACEARVKRSRPDVAMVVFEHRTGVVARQSFGYRVWHAPAVQELIQALLGPHPQASFLVLRQGEDGTLRQPVLRTKAFDL